MRALKDNIDKFEARFGEINIDAQPTPQFGFINSEKDEKIN